MGLDIYLASVHGLLLWMSRREEQRNLILIDLDLFHSKLLTHTQRLSVSTPTRKPDQPHKRLLKVGLYYIIGASVSPKFLNSF